MPRVRHSLVDQLMVACLNRLGQKRPVRPFERMAINTFSATIADDLVVKFMTPENLPVLLNSGTFAMLQRTSLLERCRHWQI